MLLLVEVCCRRNSVLRRVFSAMTVITLACKSCMATCQVERGGSMLLVDDDAESMVAVLTLCDES